MNTYLFRFGFATPALRASNSRLGTNHEGSESFLIMAETKEQALALGQKAADAYMKTLYDDPKVSLDGLGYGPGWLIENYADGRTPEYLSSLCLIRINEIPDFRPRLEKRNGLPPW